MLPFYTLYSCLEHNICWEAMIHPLNSFKLCYCWVWHKCWCLCFAEDGILSSEPVKVVMVISVIARNGHISLTAVRVAGEAPKRSTITDIIWLEKIFVSTSFVHFFFHHRTSVDDLIDLISSDRHH